LNQELLHEMINADAEVKRLNKELAKAKALRATYEQVTMDMLAENGLSNVELDNGVKIRINKKVLAETPQGKEAAANLLATIDRFKHIVKTDYNGNTLHALVRELIDNEGKLPEEFDGIITSFDKNTVSVSGN
jgi:hypothetical protein